MLLVWVLTLFFCVGFSCGWNLVSLIFTSPFRNNEQIHVYYSLKNTTKIELEATIRSKVHCTSVNVQARSSTYLWACTLWTQQSRQATGLHSNTPTLLCQQPHLSYPTHGSRISPSGEPTRKQHSLTMFHYCRVRGWLRFPTSAFSSTCTKSTPQSTCFTVSDSDIARCLRRLFNKELCWLYWLSHHRLCG